MSPGPEDRELGGLRATLDSLISEFRDFRGEQRKWQEKFEAELTQAVREQAERISSLERHRAWLAGAWAAFGVMGTMIAVALKAWLRGTLFGGAEVTDRRGARRRDGARDEAPIPAVA